MKKQYIIPSMEVFKIEMSAMLCTSGPDVKTDGDGVTDDNMGDFSQNSNSFRGGVLWEED